MPAAHTGLELGDQFDFVIDSTGDLSAIEDVNELQKDLSGAITAIIDNSVIGAPMTTNIVVELESVIESRIDFDPRVVEVQTVLVDFDQSEDTIVAEIVADTIYGPLEFDTR